MKKKIILFTFIILLCCISGVNAYAGDLIKQWIADDMPLGEIESYDTLTMLPGGSKMKVQSRQRIYDDNLSFSRCINTGGAATVSMVQGSMYVPKQRAIKFSVEKKCVLRIYANSMSSNENQTVSVSRKDELIYQGNVIDKVTLTNVFLPEGDTYYIYSQEGSLGVFMLQLEECVDGDINIDGVFDDDDILLLIKIINGDTQATAMLNNIADINADGVIDNNDRACLENLYVSAYGENPHIYSEKIWNISDMPIGAFNGCDGIYTVKENQLEVAYSNKSFADLSFTRCIKTNGGAEALGNYLPNERALKIDIGAPCKMTLYTMSGSSTAADPYMVVSSEEGGLISKTSLSKSEVRKTEVVLSKADIYYIYSQSDSGSMNIYRIELEKCLAGDINGNSEFDYGDLELITKYLNNEVSLSAAQKELADANSDGLTDENDRKTILGLILNNYNSKAFSNKEWNANDMPAGDIYEFDGLEFIPAPHSYDRQNTVEILEKKYPGMRFNKTIVLKGEGDRSKRAVRFTTDKPTLLTFYVWSCSTNVNDKYVYIADKTSILAEISLDCQIYGYTVNKYQKYLSQPGTYYIYSNGSMDVLDIKLQEIEAGDLDADGKITYNDYTLLSDYLKYGEANALADWQLMFSDIDKNGVVDFNDLYELEAVVLDRADGTYFTDKVWNMTDIANSLSVDSYYNVKENMEIDGLTFYSSDMNEIPRFDYSKKSYGELVFEYAYNTGGISDQFKRGISFNTSGPCTVEILVRTATGKNQTLYISRNMEIIKSTELFDSFELDEGGVQVIQAYLDKAGTYYIYSPEGAFRVFYISLTSGGSFNDYTESEKELYVTEGELVTEFLTEENVPYEREALYSIRYDRNYLDVVEIGFGNEKLEQDGIMISDEIEIVHKGMGIVVFKVKADDENRTGIVAPITFKAKKTGSCKIRAGLDYQL